jgi:hypothetical protein
MLCVYVHYGDVCGDSDSDSYRERRSGGEQEAGWRASRLRRRRRNRRWRAGGCHGGGMLRQPRMHAVTMKGGAASGLGSRETGARQRLAAENWAEDGAGLSGWWGVGAAGARDGKWRSRPDSESAGGGIMIGGHHVLDGRTALVGGRRGRPGPGGGRGFQVVQGLGAPLAAATHPLGPNLCQILWSVCRVIVNRAMQSNEEMGRPRPRQDWELARVPGSQGTSESEHRHVLSRFGHERSGGERFCVWEGRAVRVMPRDAKCADGRQACRLRLVVRVRVQQIDAGSSLHLRYREWQSARPCASG